MIKLDTEAGRTQAQILANEIEDGGSYQNAADMVNEWRKTQPSPICDVAVGVWAISSAYKALKPVVTRIGKAKQGSTDPDSFQCRAKKGWVTQLRVLLGKISDEELAQQFPEVKPCIC